MKTYTIEVFEEVCYRVEVEAESENEAVKKVWSGEVDFTDEDMVDSSVVEITPRGEIIK